MSVLTTDQGSDRISLQNECSMDFDSLALTKLSATSLFHIQKLSSMLAFQKLSYWQNALPLFCTFVCPCLCLRCAIFLMSFLPPACLSKGDYYSVFNCSSLSCHRPPCMLLLKAVVLKCDCIPNALGIITEVFKHLFLSLFQQF